MLNLDNYINNCEEIVLCGETIHVLEPNMKMIGEINKIEEDLSKENERKKRLEVALLLINHNREKREFIQEELMQLPFEGVIKIITVISGMRYKADQDPN